MSHLLEGLGMWSSVGMAPMLAPVVAILDSYLILGFHPNLEDHFSARSELLIHLRMAQKAATVDTGPEGHLSEGPHLSLDERTLAQGFSLI